LSATGVSGPVAWRGTVTAFDADRGLGEVTGEDGARYCFHCVAVADGSRRIEEGRAVSFAVVPGHLGRLEARGVAALDA
jgi:cold shock CspA family protein